jgi:hypothetical protein
LQATVSVSVNNSDFMQRDTNSALVKNSLAYTTITASANYRMLEERLRVNGSVSPTFGDLQRTLVNASARYYFIKNVSAEALMYLYFNNKLFYTSTTGTDVTWSVIIRADI